GNESLRPPDEVAALEKSHREMIALVVAPLAPLVQSSEFFADVIAEAVALASPQLAPAMLDQLGPAATSPAFQTSVLLKSVGHNRVRTAAMAIQRGANVNAVRPDVGSP